VGHFEGDADAYRSDEYKEAMAERDALAVYGARLIDEGVMTTEEQEAVRAEMQQLVDEAIDFARTSPEPNPEDALLHVFA